jgi:Protein of unknown function (DUF2845)
MKTNRTIIFFAAILFLSFSAGNAWAFRCGSGVVSSGDSKTQMLVTCGKPTSKEKSCENRQYTTTTNKNSRKCGKKLEIWHYNCGEGDFIYALTFENNILTDETTEGRGRGKSKCRGK